MLSEDTKNYERKIQLSFFSFTLATISFTLGWTIHSVKKHWCNATIATIERKMRCPLWFSKGPTFRCGYFQTAQEVTKSLLLNSNHSWT